VEISSNPLFAVAAQWLLFLTEELAMGKAIHQHIRPEIPLKSFGGSHQSNHHCRGVLIPLIVVTL